VDRNYLERDLLLPWYYFERGFIGNKGVIDAVVKTYRRR
jgi:hypothetical protein